MLVILLTHLILIYAQMTKQFISFTMKKLGKLRQI